tara:strand:- start:317 stop:556 length:240 start_codon:yes stop_codon:yes gene_type:complete
MEHHKKVNEIKLDSQMALVVLILSIFAPGFSTIVAGVLSKDDDKQKSAIIVGIIQILTSFILIGWIWAIMNALAIKKNC